MKTRNAGGGELQCCLFNRFNGQREGLAILSRNQREIVKFWRVRGGQLKMKRAAAEWRHLYIGSRIISSGITRNT
jgi:hypothetical protein